MREVKFPEMETRVLRSPLTEFLLFRLGELHFIEAGRGWWEGAGLENRLG